MISEDIKYLVSQAKEYLHEVREVIPIVKELKTDLIPMLEGLTDDIVDLQIRAYRRYRDNGFHHADSMQLILSHKIALHELMDKEN